MPSGSFTLSDTVAIADSVTEVIRPWTGDWSSEFGETGFASQQVTLSDTIASSENLNPVSGVTGYIATLSDTITSGYTGFSSGFSRGFGSSTSRDILSATLGIAQTLSDTVATTSSVSIVAYSVTVPSEIASSTDSFTVGARASTAVLADTVATTDSVLNITVRTLTDSVATTDALTDSQTAIAGLTDSGVLSEALTSSNANLFTLSDTLTAGETLTFNASPTLTDTIATTDSPTAVLTTVPVTVSDTFATSELLSGAGASAATLSDSSATGDTPAFAGIGLPLSDSAVSGETLNGLGSANAAVSETVSTSDAVALAATSATIAETATTSDAVILTATGLLVAETTATSDGLTFISGYVLSLSETVAAGETLSAASGALSSSVAETTATSDAVSGSQVGAGSLADTTSTSDSLATGGYGLPLADAISSTDSASATGVGSKALSETAATSETLAFLSGYAGTPSDTAATSDAHLPVLSIVPVSLSDTTATSDSLTELRPVSAAFSDLLNVTEAYNLVTYLNVLSESTSTTETLSAIATSNPVSLADTVATDDLYASRTLLDTAAASEIVTSQATGLGSFLDTLLSGDILLPVKGFQLSLADSAAVSDTSALQNSGYALGTADAVAASEIWVDGGVGSPLLIEATVIPTGGAVLLQFPGYFPVLPNATRLTISRSVDGSGIWTVIYDGPPVGVFLDIGDGSPKPLDPQKAYLWRASDYSGVSYIGPLIPASSFINQPDQLTQILIRALQGALNSMTLPPGMQRPLLTIRMPTNGWQAMPFIVVNLDLIQQTDIEIGEDVINPTPDNNWTLFANAKRVWRVTIMSQDSEERDFYRDTLLAVFRVLKATAFAPIGLDVSHTFQAVSYSSAQEWEGVTPGFYAADLMLEINGVFPAAVLTHYPVILRIEADPTYVVPPNFVVDLEPIVS